MNILVAEDDNWYAEMLHYHLSKNPDNHLSRVSTGKELVSQLSKPPEVITLDYGLPDTNGIEILKRVKYESPDTEVIIVSGQKDVGTAIELLQNGAYDYIEKNEDSAARLWNTINKIRKEKELQREVEHLSKEVKKKYNFSNGIVGTSSAINKVLPLLDKAANTSINVCISGETGTGKEVAAKAIHFGSDRARKPFIAVNVTAIPSELIESELFGHEKGAFTGANERRRGKFELAKDGTLFLDEIGEMDSNMQAKLLRVLQERELNRVGGSDIVPIRCRIICATHRNLIEEVRKGKFRQDLFYRLIGLNIDLPPLRERKQDVILLAKHFIHSFAKENSFPVKTLSDGALDKIRSYSFPGNVRELKATIDLAMVMSNDETIEAEHVSFHSINPIDDLDRTNLTLREYNLKIVKFYLEKFNNNALKVADALEVGKSTIYRMIKEIEAI